MPKHEYGLKLCVAGDTDGNGYSSKSDTLRNGKEQNMHRFMRFFLSPDGSQGGDGAGQQAGQTAGGTTQAQQTGQQGQSPAIDYTKIQQMLEGTLAAKEDTALKAYFKQQGLSQQEAEQAMATFKAQKAAQQPDVNAMQTQLAQAQAAAQQAEIDKAATLTAIELGIDAKTIPYVLKMADLSQVAGQDGKINEETLKTALNKVLEDIPALKPQNKPASGFQVGAASGNQTTTNDDALKKAFGL